MRMIVDARWTVLLGSVLLLCTLITGVPLHENDPIAAAPRDEAGSRGEWLASWSARAAQLLNSGRKPCHLKHDCSFDKLTQPAEVTVDKSIPPN
jgi:hypothetical protein